VVSQAFALPSFVASQTSLETSLVVSQAAALPSFVASQASLETSLVLSQAPGLDSVAQGFKDTVTPKAMTVDEIKETITDYGRAAKNARAAGFDGVEIHSSNGYLLHQFFSRTSNERTDEYGDSRENRAKILFEVIDEVKKYMPENRIGVRLNPSLHGLFGMTLDEESIATFDYIVPERKPTIQH